MARRDYKADLAAVSQIVRGVEWLKEDKAHQALRLLARVVETQAELLRSLQASVEDLEEVVR